MSANIELVTAHKGSPHITVDQVRDLLAGVSGDISGVKVFSNLDNAMEITILSATNIRIATGQALAGGFFFQLVDSYFWELDPGVVGYSRVDSLYLVIYEDSDTLVQTADFVYQAGELYPNGTTPIIPDAPTGTNIKESFEMVRATSSDGAVSAVESKFTNFLANSDIMTSVQANTDALNGLRPSVQANTDALNGLRFGIDNQGRYGYKKVGADTVTPFRAPKGTATPDQVLEGVKFANEESDELTGSMVWSPTLQLDANSYNEPVTINYYELNRYVGFLEVDVHRQ